MKSRFRHWLRYAGMATGITALVVGVGWPLLGDEGRRGLLVAGGIALPLQLAAFGVFVRQAAGSPGFLATWIGGTLLRFAVVGGAAFWIAGLEGVNLVVALLTLVGLLFVLLLLEPWALREPNR